MDESHKAFQATPAVRVGRTKLEVSQLGLGTAPLAGLYTSISQEQAFQTVQQAFDIGLRFFDTAPFYGLGLAEERLGQALAGLPRQDYTVSTKVGRVIENDGRTVRFDFSRDGVLRSLEASLKRLDLDRVDLIFVHDPDEHYQEVIEVVFPLLADLRTQGVVGAIGVGMNQSEMLAQFAQQADFDCFLLAGRYTLLEQGALTELLPLCQKQQISVFLGGVYNSGILATGAIPGAKYNYQAAPPDVLARVERLEAICNQHNVPLKAAALQFGLGHEAVSGLIIGAQSGSEVADNLAMFEYPIPRQFWLALKAASLLAQTAPIPGEGQREEKDER